MDSSLISYKRFFEALKIMTMTQILNRRETNPYVILLLVFNNIVKPELTTDFTPVIRKFLRQDILPSQNTFVLKLLFPIAAHYWAATDGFYLVKLSIVEKSDQVLQENDKIIVSVPQFQGFANEQEPDFSAK